MVEGQLVQAVLPEVSCPLAMVDLSHLPSADREAEAIRRAAVEFRHAFDLERGPLLRGAFRLTAEEHVLWLVVHHIACDGSSMGILFQDFAAVYTSLLRGEPSTLLPVEFRYADYAVAQRVQMQGETLREHLTYWKRQLDGLTETLELPTDRPRSAEPCCVGNSLFLTPRDIGRIAGITGPARGDLALHDAPCRLPSSAPQIHRSDRFCRPAAPVADRHRREFRQMIGCFLNLLLLRSDLSGDPSFRELLRRVRSMSRRPMLKRISHSSGWLKSCGRSEFPAGSRCFK